MLDFENQLRLVRPGSLPVALELHWNLIDSPHYQQAIATDWLWDTALPVARPMARHAAGRHAAGRHIAERGLAEQRLAGRDMAGRDAPARRLGPEAQLLHLCAHTQLHHGGHGLLWRHDIAEVLRAWGASMDVAQFIARAEEFDLAGPVQSVLRRVVADWELEAPHVLSTWLVAAGAATAPHAAEARVERRTLGAGRRFWHDLADWPDWRQRLRFAATNLVPARAYMQHRYAIRHLALIPVYYPYRWLLGLKTLVRPK